MINHGAGTRCFFEVTPQFIVVFTETNILSETASAVFTIKEEEWRYTQK